MTFEQTVSLFALAMSDVLIINMWTSDIGRHSASNYQTLSAIFEVNLKLFNQASQKKLCFILRDFVDKGNNREKYTKNLKDDLEDIWDKIYKSDENKDRKLSDFFHIEFNFLPHKEYQEDQFEKDTKLLAERFRDGPNSLFLTEQADNVPLDGFPMLIE